MSACDTCAKPGACCHDLVLNDARGGLQFSADNWQSEATAKMDSWELPFRPLRLDADQSSTEPGHVAVRFTCPAITDEGRCSIYEHRPQLCRAYKPMQDKLCVMYVEPVTEDQL